MREINSLGGSQAVLWSGSTEFRTLLYPSVLTSNLAMLVSNKMG